MVESPAARRARRRSATPSPFLSQPAFVASGPEWKDGRRPQIRHPIEWLADSLRRAIVA